MTVSDLRFDDLPSHPPYRYVWETAKLPRTCFRFPAAAGGHELQIAPPYWDSGPHDQPFDISACLTRLSESVIASCSDLRHIDMKRVLVTTTFARNRRPHGLQARITPLRFREGSLIRRIRQRDYQVQRHVVDGRELLYLMTFCLPRFLDLDFDEKMITLFHELFHISPQFDGDIRRHSGRYHVHSHSKCKYDEQMGGLVREYLSNGADPKLHAFMRMTTSQLLSRHGSIRGIVMPRPKILPLPIRAV